MAVFRVERNSGYTVMSNHHLRNKELTLKAKGLLSQMLSLPEDWDYTLAGLSYINREKIDAIREAVRELERAGYIQRSRERDEKGRLRGTDYIIYEQPPNLDLPTLENPTLGNPTLENPTQEKPTLENPMQLNKDIQKTDLPKKEKSNTDLSLTTYNTGNGKFDELSQKKNAAICDVSITLYKQKRENFIPPFRRCWLPLFLLQ